MSSCRVLAFSGSARKDSFNQRLVSVAAEDARSAGADVTVVNLGDFSMPIFDQDLEATDGLPEGVKELKQLFLGHDALLIACPEYNGSVTPLLKNAIDWVSRPASSDEAMLACYQKKVAGLLASSPGQLGGLRGLVHVRSILSSIGCLVIPEQHAVSSAHKVFDGDQLTDESQRKGVSRVASRLVEVTARLV